MPYVLRHANSGELFACILVNRYELSYYGLKYWEEESEASEQRAAFLASEYVEDPDDWAVVELEEEQLKRGNVRLKNDASNRIRLVDGAFHVEKWQSSP